MKLRNFVMMVTLSSTPLACFDSQGRVLDTGETTGDPATGGGAGAAQDEWEASAGSTGGGAGDRGASGTAFAGRTGATSGAAGTTLVGGGIVGSSGGGTTGWVNPEPSTRPPAIGTEVPPNEETYAAFEGCALPLLTMEADGPGFRGEVRGWPESMGNLIFSDGGVRLGGVGVGDGSEGELFWSIASVPDGSYYVYGSFFSDGEPTHVETTVGPLASIESSTLSFGPGDSVSVRPGDYFVAQHMSTGHLLAGRAEAFYWGGPSTCATGALLDITYWLIPFGDGTFAEFSDGP